MRKHLAAIPASFARLALTHARKGIRLPRVQSAPVLTIVSVAVILVIAAPANAFQSDLKAPAGGSYPPQGPLEVFIPADVSDDQLSRLHLVIDGVDQRVRIEVRGEYARLAPAEALAPGAHQLDLVELMPDGTIVSHGSWEFMVDGDAGLSGATVRYSGDASITSDTIGTFLSKNDTASDIASSGSADLQGRAEGSWWQLGARLPFVYDTNNQTLDNEVFDVADYLFDARVGSDRTYGTVNAGHHNIESDNVLLQGGLARRGISGRFHTDTLNSNISLFKLQSSATTGFDNFLGLNNRNDRVWGIAGSATPVNTAGFGMDMSFSWMDGRDPQLGPSTGSLEPRREAQSWGLSTTFRFLQDTLSVRGDFAHSNFEIPDDPAFNAENGEAYKLAVVWAPSSPFTVFGDEARFTLNTDYQRYSTFFTNPANVGDVRDLERYGAVAQLAANEWSVGAQFSQAYDNVDDDPALPRNRGRGAGLDLSYSPSAEQDAEGNVDYGFLGTPTYGLSFAYTDVMTVETPRIGLPGAETDNINGQAQARVDFNKGNWTWGLAYGAILTDDRAFDELSLTHSAGVQASFSFTEIGLSLTPGLQYDRTNRDGGRADDTAVVGNFAAVYSPTNVPVLAGLMFNFSRNASSDGTFDSNVYMTSANVGWIALDGSGYWPRLVLSLEGTHQYTDDRTAFGTSTDDYVAFVKASLGWSRNFGTQ